jgi:chemotaxis signal transduction protein
LWQIEPDTLHPDFSFSPAEIDYSSVKNGVADYGSGVKGGNGQLLVFDPLSGKNGVSLAVSLKQVVEILGEEQVVEMPASPAHMLGVIYWRGKVVPVLDVGMKEDGGRVNAGTYRLLVMQSQLQNSEIAVATGGDIELVKLPIAHRPCPKPSLKNPFIKGVVEWQNGQMAMIDFSNI